MKALISGIGYTDPIQGNHDGPLLNIMRIERPELVFPLFTQQMEEIEKEINWIKKIEEKVNKDWDYYPVIESRSLKTKDSHIMENITEGIVNEINKIEKEHPEVDEFIINLSSGTPAMKNVLNYESLRKNRRGIQVEAPEGSRPNAPKVTDEDYDLESEIFLNLDEEENKSLNRNLFNPNRNRESPLQYIRINQVLSETQSFLENYDYYSILNIDNFPLDLKPLIEHLVERKRLNFSQARKICKNFLDKNELYPESKNKNLTNKELEDARKLVEYFLLIKLLLKQSEINDFLVRLNPFVINLERQLIFELLKKDGVKKPEELFIQRKELKLNPGALKENLPELYEFLNSRGTKYDLGFNMFHANNIFDYYQEKGFLSEKSAELFKELRELNSKYRNEAAHNLVVYDRETVENPEFTFDTIIDNLESLLRNLYPFIQPEYFNIYDNVNVKIIDSLQEELKKKE